MNEEPKVSSEAASEPTGTAPSSPTSCEQHAPVPSDNHVISPTNERSDLEFAKLRSEIRLLQFKHSITGRVIDYLPVVGQFIALAALVWTVNSGFHQQEQTRQEGVNARYERAYTKLGSAFPSERAIAINQLTSMLGKEDRRRDEEILTALATEAALDENSDVRRSVITVFENLPAVVDKALVSSILKSVIQLQKNLAGYVNLTGVEVASLTVDEHGRFLTRNNDSLEPITIEQQEKLYRLSDLGDAIVALMKSGGRSSDMREIICMGCDFSRTGADLSGVNFSRSLLGRSTWLNMQLDGANFEGADLSEANFDGAKMQHARISSDPGVLAEEVRVRVMQQSPSSRSPVEMAEFLLPSFRCADLREASIEDFIIGVAPVDSKKLYGLETHFAEANLEGVDFDGADLFVVERKDVLPDPEKYAGSYWVLEKRPATFIAETDPAFLGTGGAGGAIEKSIASRVATILQSGKNFKQAKLYQLARLPVTTGTFHADCNEVAKMTSETYKWSLAWH